MHSCDQAAVPGVNVGYHIFGLEILRHHNILSVQILVCIMDMVTALKHCSTATLHAAALQPEVAKPAADLTINDRWRCFKTGILISSY
jgi:hypothetical protein